MSRRASTFMVLLGLVLAGVPAGSDACVLSAAGEHPCCAGTPPQATASCCADGPEAVAVTGFDCDCDHRGDTPTTAALSARSAEHDHVVRTLQPADDCSAAPGPSAVLSGAAGDPRAEPPPPLFLLDCAFLI